MKTSLQSSDKAVKCAIRELMKEKGFFNRPNHRVEPSGTQYKRHQKHRGNNWD